MFHVEHQIRWDIAYTVGKENTMLYTFTSLENKPSFLDIQAIIPGKDNAVKHAQTLSNRYDDTIYIYDSEGYIVAYTEPLYLETLERKKPRTSNVVKQRYNNKAYDIITLNSIPKGKKSAITAMAESQGLSTNSYILGLIKKDFEENLKEF